MAAPEKCAIPSCAEAAGYAHQFCDEHRGRLLASPEYRRATQAYNLPPAKAAIMDFVNRIEKERANRDQGDR